MEVKPPNKMWLPRWKPEKTMDDGKIRTWNAVFQHIDTKKLANIYNMKTVFMYEALEAGRKQAAERLGCAEGKVISVRCVQIRK